MCIKRSQVLACRLIFGNVVQFLAILCNRLIVLINRLARDQLTIIFFDLAGTDSTAPLFSIGFLSFCRSSLASCTFQVSTNIGCIDIGLHAFQFLQLCDVDGIGIVCTGCQAIDLTGYFSINVTNRYSCFSSLPSNTIFR